MGSKDWIGNSNSIYMTLGASNHTEKEREANDYYATEPKAVELLLEQESFSPDVWEPACGEGHISEVLKAHGYNVLSSDLIDRGYEDAMVMDFFEVTGNVMGRDIITNPPYKYAKDFVYHALDISPFGTKVAMFLKVQFLEGKERRKLFEEYPPRVIYVASGRLLCAKNGEFQRMKEGGGSAVAYAWFVWEKGYNGSPIVKWIN